MTVAKELFANERHKKTSMAFQTDSYEAQTLLSSPHLIPYVCSYT